MVITINEPSVMQTILARAERVEDMTPKELDVLYRVAQGLSNTGIGEELHIAYRTVAEHMGSIYEKLELHALPCDMRVASALAYLRAAPCLKYPQNIPTCPFCTPRGRRGEY